MYLASIYASVSCIIEFIRVIFYVLGSEAFIKYLYRR